VSLAMLREKLLSRHRDDDPWNPRGDGNRDLDPTCPFQPLTIEGFTRVEDLDCEEMVVTVEAGVKVAELRALAAAGGLVPSGILPDEGGTIGGLFGDPRETPCHPSTGRLRDHVLGIEGIRGDGGALRAGGRVVKNVTGYDLVRLLCGSAGALAIVTRLHLRLEKAAQRWGLIRWQLAGGVSGWDSIDRIRQLPFEPWTTVLEPGRQCAWAIVAGSAAGVAEKSEMIAEAASEATIEETDEAGLAAALSPLRASSATTLRVRLPWRQWRHLVEEVPGRWQAIYPSAGFGLLEASSDGEELERWVAGITAKVRCASSRKGSRYGVA